ncbi:MAG: hypothetical protein GY721_04495 [Deltaproteobacteria bacterium]|nr:hypothetical protein [Deltaproteobacteria bacterium]
MATPPGLDIKMEVCDAQQALDDLWAQEVETSRLNHQALLKLIEKESIGVKNRSLMTQEALDLAIARADERQKRGGRLEHIPPSDNIMDINSMLLALGALGFDTESVEKFSALGYPHWMDGWKPPEPSHVHSRIRAAKAVLNPHRLLKANEETQDWARDLLNRLTAYAKEIIKDFREDFRIL